MADRTIKAIITASASGLVSELNRASAATAKFGKDFSGSIAKNEQAINTLSNAALGIGTGLAAGVGLAIKSAADFDAQMSKVAASGDDARGSLDQLRDAAIKAGADTAFSAVEAAQGVEELAKAGVSATDILGGGLKGALDLAAAGELSVGESAEIAASAMTQFKLKGQDVPHIADLLAAAAGKAQGSVHDMGAALNQSGLVAAQTGLTIEETTGTLAAFASAGLTGSDAGTSFKTMLQSLTPSSKEAAAAMANMGFSAFDAQGNFRGMEEVAGLLREGLKDMSEEQRQATLKTIFGSDAVRAASVIYEQGSEGISKWIDATNDAGFAAETAETKLNNLNGDIEALKGSFETALIGLGESGQGPLREMVQGLTDLINKFNELDDGTKGTILRVVASVAGLTLAVGTIGKLVIAGSEVIGAFKNMATAAGDMATRMPRAASAIGKVGTAAAGAAAGVTAFYLAAKLASQTMKSGLLAESAEEAEAAIRSLAETGNSAEVDKFFQRKENPFGPELAEGINSAASALNTIVNRNDFEKFNNQASEFLEGVGISTAWGDLKESLSQVDGQLAQLAKSGNFDIAAKGFAKMIDAVPPEKRGELLEFFSDYKDALQDQANQLNVTVSDDEYVEWMGGKVPAAIQAARIQQQKSAKDTKDQGKALAETQDAAQDYEAATQTLAEAQKELDESTKDLISSFSIMKNGAIDAEEASLDFEDALQDLRDSTKEAKKAGDEHSTSLSKNTQQGRDNRRSVLDSIKALDAHVKSIFEDEAATGDLDKATRNASKALDQGEKDIRAAGRAAGYSEAEIDKMIDEMVKTPKELKTEVEATDIKKVQQQIKDLEKKIRDLESKTVNITTNFSVKGTTLDFKTGKAVKVGNFVVTPNHFGGAVENKSGVGQKGTDTELILAGVGEHMWTDREVDAVGGHDAMYRMRAAALRGEFRGYKTGGEIRPKNLAGRPMSLGGRVKKMGGRPDEVEELNIHGNVSGAYINPKPLIDAYADQMGDWGEALADKLAKKYADAAEKAMQASAGVNGNFSVIDVNNPRGLTTYRGGRFTNLFAANLRRAEQAAGATIRVFQGGWRPATSYSGTSHAGDAIDLQVNYALIKALRNVGIAAWDRTGKGNWAPHTHAIPSPKSGYAGGSAIWQWQDYTRGGDGLGSGGLVKGSSPSSKADNIPVWATAGEFMQPVDAVKYYGTEFMEAIQKKQFPRQVISHRFAPTFTSASGGSSSVQQGNGGPTVIIEQKGNYGYDEARLAREEAKRFQDAMVMVGMTAAIA